MLAVRRCGPSLSMISCHDALLSWVQGGREESVYFIFGRENEIGIIF